MKNHDELRRNIFNLRSIRSGFAMRIMCGAGAVKMGTLSLFRGGIPSASPVLNVPFRKDLIAFTHASLVL